MPNASGSSVRTIRFDEFEIDPLAGQLRKGNQRVRIQDLPFRLLVALLDRPGEIVTREELRKCLWGDTVVDFDDGLHTAIRKLRDVLGDSATHPRFIETVPRRGYCFIAPLSAAVPSDDAKPFVPVSGFPESTITTAAETIGRRSILLHLTQKRVWIPGIGIVLAGLAVLLYNSGRTEARSPDVRPLTSYRGVQRSPTLSPDGELVAFTWVGESGDNLDIYVQRIDGTGRLRLTTDPAPDQYPAWAPDGRSIAFVRGNRVLTMPSTGGPEHQLTTAVGYGLSWAPDSRMIALSDRVVPEGPTGVFLVAVDSGERRRLTLPPSSGQDDLWPAFSPDGQSVAFARRATTAHEIYRVPTSGGNPIRVAIAGVPTRGLVWSPDGAFLLFATGRHAPGLLAVSAQARDSAHLERVDIAGFNVHEPSIIARHGGREVFLAYGHETTNCDIWGTSIGSDRVSPVPLAASIRSDQAPSFSRDGKWLAFSSARSGYEEIWASKTDGSEPRQLTNFNSGVANSPRWSPDGRWIAFDATIGNNPDIYVVRSDGGPLRRMTRETSAEIQPSWSRDGQSLYFMSDRSGSKQIWRMPFVGGQPSQVTQRGGFQAFESADGRHLYYAKRQRGRGVWRVPVNGGAETLVSESVWHNLWSLAENGLYYFDVADQIPQVFAIARTVSVRRIDLASNLTTTVATIEASFPTGVPVLEVSQDGKFLAWVGWREHSAELMLIRNLRLGSK